MANNLKSLTQVSPSTSEKKIYQLPLVELLLLLLTFLYQEIKKIKV